ncbi:hypothetical protein EDD21DRAFT_369405 [Dissophora ornata]|nr:hypothetical protein EDD21DRAFT_369405 [Dissophora ornata]
MSSLKKSVKINSPLPKDLAGECKKASKILNSFIDPIAAKGLDNVIPSDILSKAKGLAIFTVIKAGFLFSGRAGAGLVVARLDDGTWSAPSAIGTGGMGFGGQIGAEITDFVIVLNNRAAVKSFTTGGNVTLGGNLSVAAGPIGRNAEAGASASLKGVAAIYSYSKTKGLFAGVSIEGSIIIERKDANEAFYRRPVSAAELLNGEVPPPPQADILYRALNAKASGAYGYSRGGGDSLYGDDLGAPTTGINRSASTTHSGRYGNSQESATYNGSGNSSSASSPYGIGRSATTVGTHGSNINTYGADDKSRGFEYNNPAPDGRDDRDDPLPSYTPVAPTPAVPKAATMKYGRPSTDNNNPFQSNESPKNQSIANLNSTGPRVPPKIGAKPDIVMALYDFVGEQATDLSFKKGDMITVVKKTPNRNDWWTGRCNGREGSFPANYTE